MSLPHDRHRAPGSQLSWNLALALAGRQWGKQPPEHGCSPTTQPACPPRTSSSCWGSLLDLSAWQPFQKQQLPPPAGYHLGAKGIRVCKQTLPGAPGVTLLFNKPLGCTPVASQSPACG